jgi:hypothetical protein
MKSVQRSGLYIPRFATWLMREPKSLCTIDNEIWFEKTHFDFAREDNRLKA